MNQRQIFGGEGSANEYRNCLQEAREFASVQSSDVVSDRPEAPFQVHVRGPYYCRVTDACAGEYLVKVRGFDTRAEANEYAFHITDYSDCELSPTIFPLEPRAAVVQADDSDLPF